MIEDLTRLQQSGHIKIFVSETDLGKNQKAMEAINILMEFPNRDLFSLDCFLRLFTTTVATILNKHTSIPMSVDGFDIIATKEHSNAGIVQKDGIANFSTFFKDDEIGVILISLYNEAGNDSNPRAYSLDLDPNVFTQLKSDIEKAFYYITKQIMIDTWMGV